MARGGGGGNSSREGGESKREREPSSLPLRYGGSYQYQSLETTAAAAATTDAEDTPTITTSYSAGDRRVFGRRLLAPAGMLLHGGVLVAVGLLCGLGVGVLIGRGGTGGGVSPPLPEASLPVLGNAFAPQVWMGDGGGGGGGGDGGICFC
jgi:hypothetical protein